MTAVNGVRPDLTASGAAPGPASGPAGDPMGDLVDAAARLMSALPRPVQRLRLSRGETTLDVEFTDAPAPAPAAPPEPDAEPETGATVPSPLVGTFYRAPAPGEDPFVQVGDVVEVGQELGIVEAMKLMNPIVAPVAGVVRAVVAGDGEPVEYDQPLVVIDPVEGGEV